MKIESIKVYAEESGVKQKPTVVMSVDLDTLCGKTSREVLGFNRRLLEVLPNLNSHYCNFGQMGGFVQRLHDGTHFNHIIEHIAIELLAQAGYDFRDERICNGDEINDSEIVIESTAVEAIHKLLPLAVDIAEALCFEPSAVINLKLANAKEIAATVKQNSIGQSMAMAAQSASAVTKPVALPH